MSWAHPQYLVETEWLAANLEDPALRVLECTTILHPLPDSGYKAESGRASWAAGHIPRSGFADLTDDLCDRAAATLYMMPPTEQMAASMARLGVGEGTHVVLYDRAVNMWAARVWWMLRTVGFAASSDAFGLTLLGHDQVSVYDASLSEWARDPSLPMETG